jgi:hypothetical protein
LADDLVGAEVLLDQSFEESIDSAGMFRGGIDRLKSFF